MIACVVCAAELDSSSRLPVIQPGGNGDRRLLWAYSEVTTLITGVKASMAGRGSLLPADVLLSGWLRHAGVCHSRDGMNADLHFVTDAQEKRTWVLHAPFHIRNVE